MSTIKQKKRTFVWLKARERTNMGTYDYDLNNSLNYKGLSYGYIKF